MREDTRNTLELTVEKANKLMSLRFTQYLLKGGDMSVNLSWRQGQPLVISSSGPDDESQDAFVLTFRFFIQNNERTSLSNMAKCSNDPDVSETWKHEIARVRADVNSYLDTHPPMLLKINNGSAPTVREIVDVFVYGGLAHATPGKKERFDSWHREPVIFPFFALVFQTALADLLHAIAYIGVLSKTELQEHGFSVSADNLPELRLPSE
jgi:hypothetical protein